MFLGQLHRRSILLSCAIASILIASPALSQPPIASGTLLVELTDDPSSHLVFETSELESRLCDVLRTTKDPDPLMVNYDDQVDIPPDPPDPPPGGGGLGWRPAADAALFPATADAAPRVVYQLPDDIVFDARGQAVTRPVPLRMCGRATMPVNLSCGQWNARFRLDKEQATSDLSLFTDASGDGGTFTLDTTHSLLVTFHHPESDTTVSWTTERRYSGFGTWRRMPGDKGVEKAGGYSLDRDCDGYQETWVAGTTELHLGWDSEAKAERSCFADATNGGRLCLGPQVEK